MVNNFQTRLILLLEPLPPDPLTTYILYLLICLILDSWSHKFKKSTNLHLFGKPKFVMAFFNNNKMIFSLILDSWSHQFCISPLRKSELKEKIIATNRSCRGSCPTVSPPLPILIFLTKLPYHFPYKRKISNGNPDSSQYSYTPTPTGANETTSIEASVPCLTISTSWNTPTLLAPLPNLCLVTGIAHC